MKLINRFSLIFSFMFLGAGSAFAQNQNAQILPDDLKELTAYEAQLKAIGDSVVNGHDQLTRVKADSIFIKTFVRALKVPGSFNYPFESLKFLKVLEPEDKSFRLYNWVLTWDDGSYHYHGAIHMNTPQGLKLTPLWDYSDQLDSAVEYASLTKDKWYGALYYDMMTNKIKGKTYYTLLGWDGSNYISNRKVIDVLSFKEDGQPVFGAPIFEVDKKEKSRILFDFNGEATLLLNFIPDHQLITFDHLVPPQTQGDGMAPAYTYVPDGTYDYFIWKKNKWVFKEELFGSFKKVIREAGEWTGKAGATGPTE